MNNKIAVRKCEEYDLQHIYDLISEIYKILMDLRSPGKGSCKAKYIIR